MHRQTQASAYIFALGNPQGRPRNVVGPKKIEVLNKNIVIFKIPFPPLP